MHSPKIVHIITRLIAGGAERSTVTVVSELAKRGYEVSLISGPPRGPEGSLVSEARRKGIEPQIVPFLVREINPVKDLLAFLLVFRLLLKEKPTVVHTHCAKAGIIGRWAAFLVGVPVIIHTPHGWFFSPGRFDFSILKNWLFLCLERLTAHFTDRIVTLTDLEKEEALSSGIEKQKEKISVIHSGVEIGRFRDVRVNVPEKKAALGLPPEAKVIGTVGRLVPLKGHQYFLSCIPKVLSIFPEIRFLIVGDGELRLNLEEMAVHLGIEKNVIFTGLRQDVPQIMKCMDVFVLSSTHEAMGRVLVEAMAAGKPVVATAVGGVPRVVSGGVTGILVEPTSASALAGGIINLLANQKLAQQMGERGKKRANAFSAEVMMREMIGIYTSLTKSGVISRWKQQ